MSILTNVFYGTHNPMDQFGNNTTPEYEKLFKELSVLQSQLREMGVPDKLIENWKVPKMQLWLLRWSGCFDSLWLMARICNKN